MNNTVFEPISVIVSFTNRRVNIHRFKWKNTLYHVSDTVSTWLDKDGKSYVTHFTVSCKRENTICEISFNHNDFEWKLVQYELIS